MLWMLLRQRARLRWYEWSRGPKPGQRIFAAVIGGIAITIGVVLAFLFSGFAVDFFADQGEPLAPLLALPFAAVFLLMVIGGIASALHRLYFASDLDFLLAAPIPLPLLYLVILVENVAVEAAPLLLALSALSGVGRALDAPLYFYLSLPFLLLLVAVIASGVNLVLLMLVTRLVPAGRLQGILRFVGAALGAGLWLAVQVGTGGDRVGDGGGLGSTNDALTPLPSTTAAYALIALAGNDPASAVPDILILLLLAGALTFAGYLLFDYTFLVNQGRMREVGGGRRAAPNVSGACDPRDALPAPVAPGQRRSLALAAATAIARKDWRTVGRDPRVISSMIFPLVMGGFFAYRFGQDGNAERAVWVGLVAVPVILLFAAPRLPSLVFGSEGSGFAVLRLAPVPVWVLLTGKWIALALPTVIVAVAATLVFAVISGAGITVLPLLGAAVWYTVGGTAAMVAAAALTPRFTVDNPRSGTGCLGQLTGMLVTLFFLAGSAGLFAWIVLLVRGEGPESSAVALAISVALMLAIVAAIATVAQLLRVGAQRLEEWEEGDA